MDFECDEAKRLSNTDKHGIDFVDAVAITDKAYRPVPARIVGARNRRWRLAR